MDSEFQKCLEKTIDYLSRRDHSAKELRDKLKRKQFSIESIESALHWVSERGYLRPPQELSQSLAHQLLKKGKGRLYIQQYLKQRGLPPPEVDDKNRSDEIEKATELAHKFLQQKKLAQHKNLDRATREKIGRQLLSRGFPSDIVRMIIYEKID